MFIVFTVSFVVYVRAERDINRAGAARQQSFFLAHELRQSSDDLTRMARAYVVTGDPAYKQRYLDLLDIREGRKPRPPGYPDLLWELGPVGDSRVESREPGVPLLDRMRQAGFSDAEFGLLAAAKADSDALTRIDREAMALFESAGSAGRDPAVRMLHDAAYLQARAGVARPIDEFNRKMDQRTLSAGDPPRATRSACA